MEQKTLLKKLKSLSILYVEDEDSIRKEISQTLSLLCKEVFAHPNVDAAYKRYLEKKPNIILSDISLGGATGIELAKKIRKIDKKTPIILLSAHTDTQYLLEAAKLKLVAYLTKPINFEELKESLFDAVKELFEAEPKEVQNNLFPLNENIYFDMEHKTLLCYGEHKKLSSYESRLIEYFIENKTRTISPEEIRNHVWDDPYDATDTALKSLIYKIRKKLGKETIQNLSGVGYFLNYKK